MYSGEKFNSITHLVGAVFALVGLGALIAVGVMLKDLKLTLSYAVFGFALVVLYVCSTLYHSFYLPTLKRIFRKLDHVAIYLLIAGTYTPFMLVSLEHSHGLELLIFVWSMAVVGICIDVFKKNRVEILQISIYLIMGWTCALELTALKQALHAVGFYWLVAGGLFYTVGIIFYVLDEVISLRHSHGIWHLFVLLGSMSHFISIIGYVR
ncbi:Hemolysin III [Pseudomonas marincola]|uniref:Hemolysin III n=1 Tax=Pseudomonas marincola TaxID=437900 RepID=A0A653DZR1_9PSED|nr:hemolysin III family protein [Pseudomonas marincola]CAE6935272.1 Hemolysin III [Pseudomonas marincola]